MSNPSRKAKVKDGGRIVSVYKLKEGYPDKEHVWCNCDGCKETFTEEELEFFN